MKATGISRYHLDGAMVLSMVEASPRFHTVYRGAAILVHYVQLPQAEMIAGAVVRLLCDKRKYFMISACALVVSVAVATYEHLLNACHRQG